MTMIDPEAIESFLTCKVKATAAVADSAAPKLATEVNAAGAVDLSMFLRDWNPEITTNTGTAPTKMGRGIDLPREGKTQYAGIEIRYPYRPQDAGTTDGNKAFNLLKQGTRLFFIVRKGILIDVPFAVGDKVENWAIKCGRQRRMRSGDDEYAEYEIVQMIFPTRQVNEDAALAS